MRKVVFFGVFSRVKREGKNRQFNSSTQNFKKKSNKSNQAMTPTFP